MSRQCQCGRCVREVRAGSRFAPGHNPRSAPLQMRVLGTLDSRRAIRSIERALENVSGGAIRTALSRLKARGLVRAVASGVWERVP